jgi:TPR repeat protein
MNELGVHWCPYLTKGGKVKNRITVPFFLFAIVLLGVVGAVWAREHVPKTKTETAIDIQTAGSDLVNLLRGKQFDMLDRRLNTLQLDYEKDTEQELALSAAFNWLTIADPELENLFQDWLKNYPESFAANLSLGAYYMAMAGKWRGDKYISETHPMRIEKMDSYLKKAAIHFKKSLFMTKKPTISYTKLIIVALYQGDDKASDHWLTEALEHDPYCITPRVAYMLTLEPRWGGSYEAMHAFVEDTRKGGKHPKLEKTARLFEGWIHWYNGFQSYLKGDYVAALDAYQKAITIEDDNEFRLARAKVYQIVGQTDLSIADLNRALELEPYSVSANYMLGITLLDKRQTAEALKNIQMAAEHGNIEAMNKLGGLYTTGDLGVTLNVEEGMKWWEKAAYFWDETAAFALGKTYERGLGIKVDKAAAVRYYRIAASQGYGPAINDLGLMLWYGYGTPTNREEAVQLWVIGAKKNIWQSKHNLQFFLSPLERFKLAFHYPQLFLEDKKILWLSIASILVLLLVLIIFVRLVKTRR